MINGTFLLNISADIFLIDSKTKDNFTYKQIHDSSCSLAEFIKSIGIKNQEIVIIMMDNSIMLAKIYFACLYAGIIVVPVNPDWTNDQIQFVIESSCAKHIFTSLKFKKKFERSTIAPTFFAENSTCNTVKNITQIENHKVSNPISSLKLSNIAIIIYTSGTTATPKGVIHTVSDLLGNGLAFIKAMQIDKRHRFFNMLPMTYLGGYYNLMLIPYLASSSVVIADTFNAKSLFHFWDGIMEHEVNTLWFVPTIMAILLESDKSALVKDYCKKNIILSLVGTAPLTTQLKMKFENKYHLSLCENYGLSETLFITTQKINFPKSGVGSLIEDVKIKIIDAKGNELYVQEEGEILVSSPYIMKHYLNDEGYFHKEKNTWFETGDIGYQDQNGQIYITGRKKDLIIKGGINISPAAIEEVLYRCLEVKECAVVGIPHALGGEQVIAVIKTDEHTEFTNLRKILFNLCQESLSSVQLPDEIIQIEELPHTFTGKIQKEKIRAWLKNGNRTTSDLNLLKTKKVNFYQPSHIAASISQALSIEFNTMVYDLQSKGIDVTVLSLGEAFFDLPLFDFSQLPYPSSYHYSHSRGILELRQVLSDYFLDQYSVKFNPHSEILITAGSKIAIYMTLMAIINSGDEVIVHEPAWVSYPEQIKLCHGIPVHIPYYERISNFEKYITNRTKVIIINNPNNPSGAVLNLDEIAHLFRLAEKYHLYILSDETYSDFVVDKENFISISHFDKEFKFSIICNSISKNLGISGWRLGYVIANEMLIEQILKLNQHLITCPATILEYYIAKHFYDILNCTKPQIRTLLEKRKKIVSYINKIGLSCLSGETTFYIFLSIEGSNLSSQDFCLELLKKEKICVVPGIGYGKSCDQYVRMSIGTESLDRIFIALDKIKRLIQISSKGQPVTKLTMME